MKEKAPACREPVCPLCTTRGLALIAVGFLLLLSNPIITRLLGVAVIAFAYALAFSGRL